MCSRFADVFAKRHKLRMGRCDLWHPKLDMPSTGVDAHYVVVASIKAAKRTNLNMNVRTNAFARIVLHNPTDAAAKHLRPGRWPGCRRLQSGGTHLKKFRDPLFVGRHGASAANVKNAQPIQLVHWSEVWSL